MSQILPADEPTRRRAGGGASPRRWAATACVLLLASGAARSWQDWRFGAAASGAETPPYSLKELPARLGDWRMVGGEGTMDEDTLEIAGCSDYISRTYADDRTGLRLSVLVAFGPAERVFPHAPPVCFPSFGYDLAGGAIDRRIEPDGEGPAAAFRSMLYTRRVDGAVERVEVFYSFRHAGQWSPDAAGTRGRFRHDPPMFKVQVQRPLGLEEVRDESGGGLVEQFLSKLVPEIDRRLAEAEATDDATG